MKVINIIKESASLLGLEKELSILNSMEENKEDEVRANNPKIESLFNLLNFAIKEICANYVPVGSSTVISVKNNKFAISLLHNVIKIQTIPVPGKWKRGSYFLV